MLGAVEDAQRAWEKQASFRSWGRRSSEGQPVRSPDPGQLGGEHQEEESNEGEIWALAREARTGFSKRDIPVTLLLE